jgi:hypothetical protein
MKLTQLLKDAQREIQQLRRRNEILGAKVEVMDSFMCVLHTKPAEHRQAMSVEQLGQKVAEIEANKPAEAQMTNAPGEPPAREKRESVNMSDTVENPEARTGQGKIYS